MAVPCIYPSRMKEDVHDAQKPAISSIFDINWSDMISSQPVAIDWADMLDPALMSPLTTSSNSGDDCLDIEWTQETKEPPAAQTSRLSLSYGTDLLSPPTPPSESCQCLTNAARILEQVTVQTNRPASLGEQISAFQNAAHSLNSIAHCGCNSPEIMIVNAMGMQQLYKLCEQMVDSPADIRVGEHKITQEVDAIRDILISSQLSSIEDLLKQFKSSASEMPASLALYQSMQNNTARLRMAIDKRQ